MSRYLAIIDSFKLKQLRALGEIYVSPRELNEIFTADPYTANYQELLEENFFFKDTSDKVFLLISLLEERDSDTGLDVCISEIEFIIALNRQAEKSLRKQYPEFRFYYLTGYQGIIQSFNNYNVRMNSSAGIAAMRVLMGLCELPPTINSYNLLDLSTDPPRELLIANHLIKKKTPYFRTGLIYRTLLTLITMYRRTVNYPDGDIGYVMDMLEIYHYAVNRSDQRPPGRNSSWQQEPAFAGLLDLYEKTPEITLDEILEHLRNDEVYEGFLHTLSVLYSKDYSILFIYLKSIAELRKFGISRSQVANVASWCNNTDERELLASWLGCCFGYMKILPAVLDTMELNIMATQEPDGETHGNDNDDGLITSFESNDEAVKKERRMTADEVAAQMSAANDERHGCRTVSENGGSPSDENAGTPGAQSDGTALESALRDLTHTSPVTPVSASLTGNAPASPEDKNGEPEEKGAEASVNAGGHGSVIDLASFSNVNDDNAGDPQMYLTKSDLENISFTDPGEDGNIGISGILPEGFLEFSFYSEDTGSFLNLSETPENRNFEVIELYGGDERTEETAEGTGETRPDYDTDTAVYAKGVRINHAQLKVANYVLTYLEGILQALTINPDFTALSVQEINCAVAMLIRTEAPISRECIVRRFSQICRQTGTAFKNEHRLKVMQEINHVIEKMHLITDLEDFIYVPRRPVYSRNRRSCTEGQGMKTVPKEIRYSSYVSRQEIIATIRLIKNDDNLGLGGIKPMAADIYRYLGLVKNKNRNVCQKEIDRINRIISEVELKDPRAATA